MLYRLVFAIAPMFFFGQFLAAQELSKIKALDPGSLTMYEEIGNLFSASAEPRPLPDNTNILVHIGRCYTASAPSTPIAAAVVTKRGSQDDGPLGETIILAASIWKRDQSANYFDDKPLSFFSDPDYQFYTVSNDSNGRWIVGESRIGQTSAYLVEQIGNVNCYYFETIRD